MTDPFELLQEVVGHIDVQSQDKVYRECGEMLNSKHDVLRRFQPIFSPARINRLTAEDYKAFLQFKNNRHWTGLYRAGNAVANDMPTLRGKLEILLDEALPISQRIDAAETIYGLGKGIVTAILHIAFPDKYGVWNDRVRPSMEKFKLWPALPRGGSPGEKYEVLNRQLLSVAEKLDIDLWTLDSLWWIIDVKGLNPISADSILEDEENAFPEGKVVFRTHKSYERNSALVQKKKQLAQDAGLLICSICNFDFRKVYGKIGAGFIECHHTVPISEYSSKTKTRIEDLALVCSNCHRMLHRQRPCLTIQQMKQLVETYSNP